MSIQENKNHTFCVGRQEHSRKREQRQYPNFLLNNGESGDSNKDQASQPTAPLTKSKETATKITAQAVHEWILIHKSYTPPGWEAAPFKKLPEYDDISQYGVNATQGQLLWEKETARLLEAANTLNDPLLFEDKGIFRKVSKSEYEKLAELGELLNWNMTICQHDNDLLALEHCFPVFDAENYRALRSRLQRGLDSEQAFLNNINIRLCWLFIDHVTAVTARLLTQVADSDLFHAQCIAVLVKLTTKLKILCKDPKRYSERSLDNGRDLLAREDAKRFLKGIHSVAAETLMEDNFDDMTSAEEGRARERQIRRMNTVQQLFSSEGNPGQDMYFAEMWFQRYPIQKLLRIIFANLSGGNRASGLSIDAFEISTLVYRTGFEGSPALLGQDRDGEILASSASNIVRNSYTAFKILRQSTLAIKTTLGTNAPTPPGGDGDARSHTQVGWEWADKELTDSLNDGRLILTHIRHVVTLGVPLLCTQPPVAALLMQLRENFNFINGPKVQLEDLPEADFETLYYMKTTACEEENAVAVIDNDVRSLSQSLMAHQKLLVLGQDEDASTDKWENRTARLKSEVVNKRVKRLKVLEEKIESWTIDERAIVVKCRRYVAGVGVVCGFLVLGGLIIGFSVHQRIRGVDPFNVTTFCWVLAGFVILITKSVHVENWPWRDFLLGRVTCRSISELCSVTGEDVQDVLGYLLHNEASTILITRGPYNKPFGRPGNDGFSIDIKLELCTMLLSGIIVLKVATPDGSALVCLSVRKGTRYRNFSHSHERDKEEWNLVCFDPPRRKQKQDAKLKITHLGWNKVLGLYNEPHQRFY